MMNSHEIRADSLPFRYIEATAAKQKALSQGKANEVSRFIQEEALMGLPRQASHFESKIWDHESRIHSLNQSIEAIEKDPSVFTRRKKMVWIALAVTAAVGMILVLTAPFIPAAVALTGTLCGLGAFAVGGSLGISAYIEIEGKLDCPTRNVLQYELEYFEKNLKQVKEDQSKAAGRKEELMDQLKNRRQTYLDLRDGNYDLSENWTEIVKEIRAIAETVVGSDIRSGTLQLHLPKSLEDRQTFVKKFGLVWACLGSKGTNV